MEQVRGDHEARLGNHEARLGEHKTRLCEHGVREEQGARRQRQRADGGRLPLLARNLQPGADGAMQDMGKLNKAGLGEYEAGLGEHWAGKRREQASR